MKSEWYVQQNLIAGEDLFIACRVRDTSKVVHSGSLEHYGQYSKDRQQVQEIVDKLNSEKMEDER